MLVGLALAPGSPARSMPIWQWASMKAGVTTGYLPRNSPLASMDTPFTMVSFEEQMDVLDDLVARIQGLGEDGFHARYSF